MHYLFLVLLIANVVVCALAIYAHLETRHLEKQLEMILSYVHCLGNEIDAVDNDWTGTYNQRLEEDREIQRDLVRNKWRSCSCRW